jgi:hypothetical protein
VFEPKTRANSITVRWNRPSITGRDDYYYTVHYSDPDNHTSFLSHNPEPLVKTGPVVEYTLSGLRVLTEFTIRVVVHNGVSEQDPGSEADRMCEVGGVTGTISKCGMCCWS